MHTCICVGGTCINAGLLCDRCEAFAEKGCTVYATSRKIESMDGFSHEGIHRLALDVTSDKDVQDAVDTVIQAEGKIDILVNNAGVICIGELRILKLILRPNMGTK